MKVSTLSAQELLRLCLQTQDESLWQEFVHRVQPFAARVVVKSVRHWAVPTPELVDDLVQDIYVKLFANNHRALREFDCRHENALYGFLKVVASRVVQDYFRHRYADKNWSGAEDEELDPASVIVPAPVNPSNDPDRNLRMDEIDKRLEEMLAGDPDSARNRAIFWLYYRHGFTAKEISQLPGINLSVKGVESVLLRLTRALGDMGE